MAKKITEHDRQLRAEWHEEFYTGSSDVIKIAKQLGYGKKVIEDLKRAKTKEEQQRILTNARLAQK